AGRFLLQFLAPAFPYELIEIAETRKPFLSNEAYHFSISHCGDYAAAIVSKNNRVGIDIEIQTPKIERISEKFLSKEEQLLLQNADFQLLTLFWSAKESVFKWYGEGSVDFSEHIQLKKQHEGAEIIDCFFSKTKKELTIHYRYFENMVLAWVVS
ncbi:MAG: 4'-phosphopantetheinyl transferase superfamily protein, partial [Bacteroidota bacterium]